MENLTGEGKQHLVHLANTKRRYIQVYSQLLLPFSYCHKKAWVTEH